MRVLIADKFEEWGAEALREAGCEVLCDPNLSGDGLRNAVAAHHPAVLIVRSTKVTADVLEASPQLGLVVRAGAGYNTIDVPAASRRGVLVSNCPGKNAVAVAELTFGLILALDRRIVDSTVDLRRGDWNKTEYSRARGLKDRTIGIVGMGMIGEAVADRAVAFEMNVLAWSRSLTDARANKRGVDRCATLEDLAARSNILTIHVAATPQTKNLIGRSVLERLAPGSYVINTARGDVLDYPALAEMIQKRGLRAGLDVFPDEPAGGSATYQAEILKSPGVVYGTPHIGASTDQAQDAIAAETVRIVREFQATGRAPNTVNVEARSPAQCQMIVRHFDKVGVLATILDKLRRANINVKEMSNTVFQESKAAVAVIRLAQTPEEPLIREIAGMSDMVIHVEVKAG